MITAIVLIDCASDSIPEVAETLASFKGVSEVYSVA
ncbi:MAG TPA: Lrp/AsnC family transcriptional regulator, partial [Micromonosporaceae bacterium]